MDSDLILAIVVVTALAFDFTNGFHDTANVVATGISTRAVPPRAAVAGAAGLNFAGAFISLEVAATVANGIVEADLIPPTIVFAGGIDPMVVIRWKDVIDRLEEAVDACDRVAHVLEGIAVKHG